MVSSLALRRALPLSKEETEMTGTISCWVKEQMGWLSVPDMFECTGLTTPLHLTRVAVWAGVIALAVLGGRLIWKGDQVPPILTKVVVAGACVGTLLNMMT